MRENKAKCYNQFMSIEFSEHARIQLRRRNIFEKLILKAVREPDDVLSSFRGRKLRRMKVSDKILEVATKTEGSKITVITAYYLEEEL